MRSPNRLEIPISANLMTFFSYIRRELGISRKEVEPQILKGG
jgi:hypothetical protein